MKKITVTKATLNAISVVDRPAIGLPAWRCVGGNVFVGPVLIPNMDIKRLRDGEEFFITFTPEVVADLGWQIYENDLFGAIDVNHSGDVVSGAEITNLWVESDDYSIATDLGYKDGVIPIGTLMAQISLPAEYADISNKKGLNGFSVDVTVEEYEESEE